MSAYRFARDIDEVCMSANGTDTEALKTLIVTDNAYARRIASELHSKHGNIDVVQSPSGQLRETPRLNVKEKIADIIANYQLVISIHCKQMFPAELVNSVRCVNVHPGFNPFNRGWYPQVFSIINGLKAGVTIHEIDEQLDHGAIIVQKECTIEPWDTSGSAYAKIMALERELVVEHFVSIRDQKYTATKPAEGNLNLRRDFDSLKQINLEERGTFGEFLNRLRALTHEPFNNAYFVDDSGRKVFVRVMLKPEDDTPQT